MIVDWILRCYPRAWRERYEAELRDIAAAERLSLRLVFDLLLGALDARLHPNLVSSQGAVVLKPAGGLPLISGEYPEHRSGGQVALGVLAWLGWTALAVQAIHGLLYVPALAGLLPLLRDPESGAWSGLAWIPLLGGALVGNILIRRLVHAGARWQHGPGTPRAWVVLAVLGTASYTMLFNVLWVVGVRPD